MKKLFLNAKSSSYVRGSQQELLVKSILILPILVILFLSIFSCKNYLGYGVVLWNDPDSDTMKGLANGQIIEITKESKVNDSFVFYYQGKERSIPAAHLAFFRHRNNAKAYSKQFSRFRDWYAINTKVDGLVIRKEASVRSEQVYRLRPGQTVKVLAQASGNVNLGNIEGRWYHLLTDDGVKGFTFDYYLRLEDRSRQRSNSVIKQGVLEKNSEFLEVDLNYLKGIWYDKKYTQKLHSGKNIDIRLLMLPNNSQLYFNKNNNQITLYSAELRTPALEFSFDPGQVQSDSASQLIFPNHGVRVSFSKIDEISVYYKNQQGKEVIKDLQQLGQNEFQRYQKQLLSQRKIALAHIFQFGSQFSAAKIYGSIQLHADGTFTWSNTEALVKAGILSSAQRQGIVYFPYQLKLSLQDQYDQALTFVFEDGKELVFLLKMLPNKQIMLRYIPLSIIDRGGTVTSDGTPNALDITMSIEGRTLVPNDLF